MGKVVKTVLKIAAVAAISFFAPPLAAAIAPSIGLGTALGTTVLAAGLGAGAGELAGVGWQAGLLAGGLSGAGQNGLFGGKPPPGGVTGGGTAGGATGGAAPSPFLNASTPASLSGYPAAAATGPAVSPFLNPSTPALLAAPGAAAGGAAAGGAMTLGQALGAVKSNPASFIGGGVRNLKTGFGEALGAVGIGGTTGGLNLGAVAPSLLAAGLVGNPGGAMAKAQQAQLAQAQQFNAAVAQQRLNEADKLRSEANYFDPEYMARQNAENAMIKGAIAEKEATRGFLGERLDNERRRYRLGTARSAGTAYQQGFGTGVNARLATRQAGISAMPTEYPVANPSYAMAADEYAQNARSAQARELSKLFGKALNIPTEDEQKPKGLTLKLV